MVTPSNSPMKQESDDHGWSSVQTGSVEKRVILEIGCGVGNTIFPILKKDENVFVHACDFSPRAVDIVKTHECYDEKRVNVFVCDLTSDPLIQNISPSSVDTVTMLFVLSAISPSKMASVIQNVVTVLKPNGRILFRDYAVGDLAQKRLKGKCQQISENFYVRGDGTRAYYFSESFLRNLFEMEGGLITENCELYVRDIENRAKNLNMHRRWIQAVFYLPDKKGEVNTGSNRTSIPDSDCLQIGGKNTKMGGNEKVERDGKMLDEEKGSESSRRPESHVIKIRESKEMESEMDTEGDIDLSDSITTQMFMPSSMYEMHELRIGQFQIRALCQPREDQHMQKKTGLLLWDSSIKLSNILLRNPALTEGKTILELGCGCLALASLFASVWSKSVIATDGDPSALDLLSSNFRLNAPHFPLEKISTKQLVWGEPTDIFSVKQDAVSNQNSGFDLILGADVVYVHEAVPKLFQTARDLLSRETIIRFGSHSSPPLLVLCHITRRVTEKDIISHAKKNGLMGGMMHLRNILVDELILDAENAEFVGGLKEDATIRVMCFTLGTQTWA